MKYCRHLSRNVPWDACHPGSKQEFLFKHTAPESLVLVLDHFHQIKQSGNFGGVFGGQLLKWNLMSSESECLPYLYMRWFSFWYLLDFEGPLKVSRPRGRAQESRRCRKENFPLSKDLIDFFLFKRF
jgi:hypothetical protein